MPSSKNNKLLSELLPDELDRLRPHLVEIELVEGDVLCGDVGPVTHVYFPTTAVVSHLCSAAAGESIDVAATGHEGVVGLTFASGNWSPGQAVVQRAGRAWRLPASVLRAEFAKGGSLQLQALRYQQWLMVQMAQSALCSRMHRVDQQLCRWILTRLEHGDPDRLAVTQQQVARMLGVRREAVSGAATRLESGGVLHWGRGRLHVMDRDALEAGSCECYQALRGHAQRLLPVMQRAA
ncbi:Crp/Fnr family transcriptional regulator [Ramlibacter ginsenosidimutans]|uniref:Crp/Fnr family transcriptional regulator n=1 Tax=Ramlibacter ginsenosidimutans TaxID=502333 RepID=A0A934TS79_9BURK|nr:Crp/Fnr family transcriptional regulator [Ramlibacter ginsenosidimutans]MBK6006403.1 Crp/Fnr family transcriptional regulator [Ramlibacter ginsenosidimutans]